MQLEDLDYKVLNNSKIFDGDFDTALKRHSSKHCELII